MSVDILSWLDDQESTTNSVEVISTDTLTSTHQGTCFEINREVFLHLMDKAILAIPLRDSLPVYANFQFKVSENKLDIVASNDEITIVATTSQVTVKTAGIELFPAKDLYAIVKEAEAGSNIYCEATVQGLVVVAGNFSSELQMFRGTDFPEVDNIDDLEFHSFDKKKFIDAINTVKYALPGKDFGGLASLRMISVKNGKFTTCDSNRFQQVRLDNFKLSMQLRAYGLSSLLKVLSFSDEPTVEVADLENKLVFKLNNLLYFTKKAGNVYPNVEQLWLKPALTNNQVLLVDKAELVTAIKQVKTAADSESNAIALVIDSNRLEVRIKSSKKTASTTIACTYDGKERKLVVNFIHLAEMLKAYTAKECKFLLGTDTKTRKATILLKDEETMALATISQLVAYRADL